MKCNYTGGLFRYRDDGPCLAIELFSNTWRDRSRWTPGWAHAFFSPDQVNREYAARGVNAAAESPSSLIYVYSWEPKDTDEKQPFACVYYPDWPKLADRLLELAETDIPGCDLLHWNLDATSSICRTSRAIRGAFWNVPMRWLEGLFTVTMINGEPDRSWLDNGKSKTDETLRQFEQLKAYAGDRHLDTRRG